MSAETIQQIGRRTLPDRREGISLSITFRHVWGERTYSVTYGVTECGRIREVFCWPERSGSDMDALLSDACIGFSHALQHGASVTQLAMAMGQLRPEGAADGLYPPASPLGAILRAGIEIEQSERKAREARKQS